MGTLRAIFFLPPMAVARLGGGATPLESFEWVRDVDAHGHNKTVIKPSVTLAEQTDGSVTAYMPEPGQIRFRDEKTGKLRPVAPFFEMWARLYDPTTGEEYETPVNVALLKSLKLSPESISYRVTVGNRKATRRTGDAACSFTASVVIGGNDFTSHELLAFSPRTSKQQPLVDEQHPIPLGRVRAIHPIDKVMGPDDGLPEPVDLSVLRLRFAPPAGEVYGPPDASFGPATLAVPGYLNDPPASEYGRIHEIVPPGNRKLNPDTPWSEFIMMSGMHDDPEPHDSYDGARVGNNQSWGIVDDTSDALIEATLAVRGERFRAIARVFTGPPDFAPDRRPFYSLADELDDRDLPVPEVTEKTYDSVKAEVVDIFRRAFETNSLINLDDIRAQGLKDNAGLQAKTGLAPVPGLPSTDAASMTSEDEQPPSKIADMIAPQPPSIFSRSVPDDRLPYTAAVPFVHEQMLDERTILDCLRRKKEIVKALMRPPFGLVAELEQNPDPLQPPNPRFRDPRIVRDMMHDARMPPYMRDSNYFPLSLSRRQYWMLMQFIDYLDRSPTPGEANSPVQDRQADQAKGAGDV